MSPSVQKLMTTVQMRGERGQAMVAQQRVILRRTDGEGSRPQMSFPFAALRVRMTKGRQ
jgi:hypothetical protein